MAEGELPPFTGGRFELFDGGGDRAQTRDRFTMSDIFAEQLLSVDVPAAIALDLIDGGLGDRAAGLLEQIPVAVPLRSRAEALLCARAEPGT